MTALTLNHGEELRGATPDTIARREWGKLAFFEPARDRNSPHAGMILRPNRYDPTGRTFDVLAEVAHVETEKPRP